MSDVTVVTVTYRSAATIGNCLRSLPRACATRSLRAVVVDNASDDDTVSVVHSISAASAVPVEVIERPSNDGFAAGCNAGLASADGAWVVFLNPDAVCLPDAIDRLVAIAEQTGAGVVAPALVGPDGELQPTIERMYKLGRIVLGMARVGGANRATAPPASGPPIDVAWVHAAAMVVPTEVARAVGGFDERFFMYAEDMDFCARVRAFGRRVLVAPEVRVRHVGGASAALSGGDSVTAGRRVTAMTRFLAKHQGRAAALTYAVLTVASAGTMTLADRVRGRGAGVHAAMLAAAAAATRRGGVG